MTIQKFNNTSFGKGDKVVYHGDNKKYLISQVDFAEQLLGLAGMIENDPSEISWVRCENCHYLPYSSYIPFS